MNRPQRDLSPSDPYSALMAHCRQTEALAQASALLGWEQEVMMPRRAAGQRAEQIAAVSAAAHARRTDPMVAEWLSRIDSSELTEVEARNVALVQRDFDRETRVPEALRSELARRCSMTQGIWAEARRNGRFADLAPSLTQVLELKREEAAHLSTDGAPLYDAALDNFEPGMTSAFLLQLFERLRGGLLDLRSEIAIDDTAGDLPAGDYSLDAQKKLNREITAIFGYDVDAGRLDEVTHPFCSGTLDDVRITTRYVADDPLNALFTTIHETGHAVYEQNRQAAWAFLPVAGYASMGIHESQSRLFENQIGRSRAFAEFLLPRLHAHFPDFPIATPDMLHRVVNRVTPGFIRVDADEVHYNLHVILRTHLERDMIEGRLEIAGLEEAWNTRFEADFGRKVDSAKNGVLQDVHWSAGLWGYFPTYALGNIYAAALHARLKTEIPELGEHIAAGETASMLEWLRRTIHSKGNLLSPVDLLTQVLGSVPDEAPLMAYLRGKFVTSPTS